MDGKYTSVERIDFEKTEGESIEDMQRRLLELFPGEKAIQPFTMTIFLLEKEEI